MIGLSVEPALVQIPAVPKWTPPMDSLRTAVSILAHFDQDVDDNSTEANLRKAERLYAQIPLAIAEAFRQGNLGIHDYHNLRNIQADTEMRSAIAGTGNARRDNAQTPQ